MPFPLSAGETGWQEIMPDVRMRLLTGDGLTEAGTTWAALQIEMPQDTKTYWRVPGETGIPPVFDFSRSSGISNAVVAWPFPTRDEGQGYIDQAYFGHLTLPIEVTPEGNAVNLTVDVTLGVCSEICVPVDAQFKLPVDLGAPDKPNAFRIEQALARVPLLHTGEGIVGDAFLDSRSGDIRVAVGQPLDPDQVIAEISGDTTLFDRPRYSEDGAWLHFDLLGRPDALLEGDQQLRLSYSTPEGAFEVVRPLVSE